MKSVPVLPLAIGDSSGAVSATAAESNMLLGSVYWLNLINLRSHFGLR